MKWYKRFPGDFEADTGHLSVTECGAYNKLLDHYYSTEKPLPLEPIRLFSIARAVTEDEKAAVKRVVAEFFPTNGDGMRHNKRADEEIEKARSKSKSRSEAGVRGAKSRWGTA